IQLQLVRPPLDLLLIEPQTKLDDNRMRRCQAGDDERGGRYRHHEQYRGEQAANEVREHQRLGTGGARCAGGLYSCPVSSSTSTQSSPRPGDPGGSKRRVLWLVNVPIALTTPVPTN